MSLTENRQYFFNGDHQGEHLCSCGETNSCLGEGSKEFNCNCDASYPIWASDAGIIDAKEILPITQVFYGPLNMEFSKANYTIGGLKCKGMFNTIYIQ